MPIERPLIHPHIALLVLLALDTATAAPKKQVRENVWLMKFMAINTYHGEMHKSSKDMRAVLRS